jgi:hypothetical protein
MMITYRPGENITSDQCKCNFRRDDCLKKCTVSRESHLHERTCEQCSLGGNKNPEKKAKKCKNTA